MDALPSVETSLQERRLVRRLRAGDGSAYAELHERYDRRMVALARSHGASRAVAQEVVQETWTAVVRNIHSFRGQSSLKTWIFRILINAVNAQVRRERRSLPLSETAENVFELGHARRTAALPADEHVVLRETIGRVRVAIESLSATQRDVITLRDVHGWSADEVCRHLGLSAGNQRVLLYRARAHVRRRLATYLDVTAPAAA
jgi:RNA polymerase sigma-70 factor (ECF subfamily)